MTAVAATALPHTRSLLSRHLPIPISITIKPPNPLRPPPPQFSLAITHNRTMAFSSSPPSSATAYGIEKSSSGDKITAPYGSWKSLITADLVSGAEKRLGGFAVAGDGRALWIETQPQEKGHVAGKVDPFKLWIVVFQSITRAHDRPVLVLYRQVVRDQFVVEDNFAIDGCGYKKLKRS